MVAVRDVTAESRRIRQDGVVTDVAIVRHVGVRHDEDVTADRGHAATMIAPGAHEHEAGHDRDLQRNSDTVDTCAIAQLTVIVETPAERSALWFIGEETLYSARVERPCTH